MINSNKQYIIAIVVMTTFGVAADVLISIFRPGVDSLLITGALFAFLAPTTISLLTFMKAQETSSIAEKTHILVNSRMSEFIKALEKSALDKSKISRAEGVIEGKNINKRNRR